MKKRIFTSFLVVAALFGVLAPTMPAQAIDILSNGCSVSGGDSAVCKSKSEGATKEDAAKKVKDVINIVLMILGIIAVIMIVVGAFRYITSSGDENGITQGKNTIIYAVVGLVVAILAYSIVNFVIFKVSGS